MIIKTQYKNKQEENIQIAINILRIGLVCGGIFFIGYGCFSTHWWAFIEGLIFMVVGLL